MIRDLEYASWRKEMKELFNKFIKCTRLIALAGITGLDFNFDPTQTC